MTTIPQENQKPKQQIALFLEKVISTFVQAFATYVIGMNALGADVAQAAALAAIAAAGTAALAALPLVPTGLPFYTDLFFRVVRTFTVTAGTLFFGAANFDLSVGALQAAIYGAVPAVLAILKGLMARRTGEAESPALLSSRLDPASFSTLQLAA